MTTVMVQRKFGIYSQFLDTTLQAEVQGREGESIKDVIKRVLKEIEETAAELRREAESMRGEIIKETIQGITPHDARGAGQISVISKEKPQQDTVAQLIADIYTCTEFKVLEGYRLLARTKPELQAAYDQMKLKLTVL